MDNRAAKNGKARVNKLRKLNCISPSLSDLTPIVESTFDGIYGYQFEQ